MALVGSLPELKSMSAFELMMYVSSRDVSNTPTPTPSVNIWRREETVLSVLFDLYKTTLQQFEITYFDHLEAVTLALTWSF